MSWRAREKTGREKKGRGKITSNYVEVGGRRNRIKLCKSPANNDPKNKDISYNINLDHKPDTLNTVQLNARAHSKPVSPYQRRSNLPSTNGNYRSFHKNSPGPRSRNTHQPQIVEYSKGDVICIESPYNELDLNKSSDHSPNVMRQQERELSIEDMSSECMNSGGVDGDYKMVCEKAQGMSINSPEFIPEVEGGELINMVGRMNLSDYIDNIFIRYLGSKREGGLDFVDTFDLGLAINISREIQFFMNNSNRNTYLSNKDSR